MDAVGEISELRLPNHLVEKIISQVPFPYVFKARVLNKEWRSKFEEVVRPASINWPTYCPAFLHTFRSNHLLGFVAAQNSWFTLKLQPSQLTRPHPGPSCVVGVLYCVVNSSPNTSVTITNLLTGKKRTIPHPSSSSSIAHNLFFAIDLGDENNYQLVLYGMDLKTSGVFVERHIYDFSTKTWESKSLATTPLISRLKSRMLIKSEYLDGNMYYIGFHAGDETPQVVQVNFEDGTISGRIIQRETWMTEYKIGRCGVLRCGSRIITFIMAFKISVREIQLQEIAHLYEVNTVTLELVKLSQSPIWFDVSRIGEPVIVASRNAIHFCGLSGHLAYSLESNTWSTHEVRSFASFYYNGRASVTTVTFEPRLSPFMVP